jgi:hypothetical protein
MHDIFDSGQSRCRDGSGSGSTAVTALSVRETTQAIGRMRFRAPDRSDFQADIFLARSSESHELLE